MQNKNEYYGYSLFNDIEDKDLQKRNRGVILTNILEDGFKKGKITSKNALMIIGYFQALPEESRKEVREEFIKQANARGFQVE